MRNKQSNAGITVNAIAGTNVVLLGMDLSEGRRKGCLGFAIQREDHTEDERYWLSGMKTFKETDPGLGPGGQVSSRQHPFQTFQWADYSAKPKHDYTYTVIPLGGAPRNLVEVGSLAVPISTEAELANPKQHETSSVFFNRGAIASQEYARRFQNIRPDKLGGDEQKAAFRWLSRGLLEAFVAFVARAKGESYGLFGAIYEFQWPEALKAIKAAAASRAHVEIIYDGLPGKTGPKKKNVKAIKGAGLTSRSTPRTHGKIMHNKFLVLTKNDKAIAVWTGSTNLTENGIFGHLNCGHIIEDPEIAKQYYSYWKELSDDPETPDEKDWMEDNNPAPPDTWNDNRTVVFSPRRGLDVLQWYADIAGNATRFKPLFMTFAFGMHKFFQAVYSRADGVLRFALMEKEGNGKGIEQGRKDIARIRKLPNVVVAIGRTISVNSFDRWLQELPQLTRGAHVKYVHTKFMLVDPLGTNPVVVTGSANFSKASTDTNDENMIVIRNDQRVADIYMGEFMRTFSHYAFREAVARWEAQGRSAETWEPQDLVPDASWQKDFFAKGDQRFLRRLYFAGK
ncbi:MAG TPA: phospholipase D-like domain-containing protein [Planctomycetaceae bacterium]|jgi:phosphatidylserine/phosphatidylglycerophosphate/cardiolipin synthase-like enzyme|nr:phospholipase D-like domain-containing protein [Planctomycetaceae bacterium]